MKQITSQQAISFLNQLINRIDAKYTAQIDNPTSLKKVDQIELRAIKMTSEIQNVINYISLYN